MYQNVASHPLGGKKHSISSLSKLLLIILKSPIGSVFCNGSFETMSLKVDIWFGC